jgi:hypothetical protein
MNVTLTEEQFEARFPLVRNHLVSNAFDGHSAKPTVPRCLSSPARTPITSERGGSLVGTDIHVVNRIATPSAPCSYRQVHESKPA